MVVEGEKAQETSCRYTCTMVLLVRTRVHHCTRVVDTYSSTYHGTRVLEYVYEVLIMSNYSVR